MFLAAFYAAAPEISAPGVVVDGDRVGVDRAHVRLWGIDAPEDTQACTRRDGAEWRCKDDARDALRRLVDHASVNCAPVDQEIRAHVARCSASGLDLGAAMVRAAWALDCWHYNHRVYAQEETDAKAAGRGVWSGSLVPAVGLAAGASPATLESRAQWRALLVERHKSRTYFNPGSAGLDEDFDPLSSQ